MAVTVQQKTCNKFEIKLDYNDCFPLIPIQVNAVCPRFICIWYVQYINSWWSLASFLIIYSFRSQLFKINVHGAGCNLVYAKIIHVQGQKHIKLEA